jgi:tetratricopeptide (TPR) repeat protein
MPALVDESVGRGEEGLKKMEDMIDRLGQQENADLEKAVTTYGKFAVELNGADETIDKLKTMGRKPFQPDAVKAWLLISRIDIIEEELEEGPKATAEINTAFSELQGFDKSKLAPYVLAQTGDFLRNNGQEGQSVPFFEEILSRPGIDAKDYAYTALAKTYFRGSGSDKHTKALEYVEWVLTNSGNTKLTEECAYERAAYYTRGSDWPKAEENWFAYVDNKTWRGHSPEAWFRLGEARQKTSNPKGALSAYLQCFGKYAQFIEYSIPAISRSATIQREAGKTKEAFDLSYLAGAKFKNYISDPRFSSEWSNLRGIFDAYSGEYFDFDRLRRSRLTLPIPHDESDPRPRRIRRPDAQPDWCRPDRGNGHDVERQRHPRLRHQGRRLQPLRQPVREWRQRAPHSTEQYQRDLLARARRLERGHGVVEPQRVWRRSPPVRCSRRKLQRPDRFQAPAA